MGRILIVGVPRSGTTWLARTVARAPGVAYVHEPDNRRLEPLAFVGTRGLGSVPWLRAGQEAEDYRLLWAMAFAGGWPSANPLIGPLKRIANLDRVPRALRIMLQRQAARIAARGSPAGRYQVVKSVHAYLSVEWIVRQFDPAVVVVWRHPFNLAPAWIDQGWTTASAVLGGDAVRTRFQETSAWPPPEEEGLRAAAWAACARSVLLLETAAQHPAWTVVSHEEQSIDPVAGFTRLFRTLGLEWTADVERALAESNRPGTGYATQRRWEDEPLRWKERLDRTEQAQVASVLRRFEDVSEVAAKIWRSSAAVGAR